MVDMHIHSVYSDGDKSVEEILKMCEEKKLEYISLTDHNTCKQYDDLTFSSSEKIFSGKIIKGVELNTVFDGRNIEILGYNINPDIINKWRLKYYKEDVLNKQQKIFGKMLLE